MSTGGTVFSSTITCLEHVPRENNHSSESVTYTGAVRPLFTASIVYVRILVKNLNNISAWNNHIPCSVLQCIKLGMRSVKTPSTAVARETRHPPVVITTSARDSGATSQGLDSA
ncbi:hypothetical protein PG985_000743 [Apiospora marii]|uniref:Uncharacterized protein n=1 Tax=Apiospora marii TaxID=335849 RepID=A0ABR1R3M2_9PEZI